MVRERVGGIEVPLDCTAAELIRRTAGMPDWITHVRYGDIPTVRPSGVGDQSWQLLQQLHEGAYKDLRPLAVLRRMGGGFIDSPGVYGRRIRSAIPGGLPLRRNEEVR